MPGPKGDNNPGPSRLGKFKKFSKTNDKMRRRRQDNYVQPYNAKKNKQFNKRRNICSIDQESPTSPDTTNPLMQPSNILSDKSKVVGSKLKALCKELKNEKFKENFIQELAKNLTEKIRTPNSVSFRNIISVLEILDLESRSRFSEEMLMNTDSANFVKVKNNRLEKCSGSDNDSNEDDKDDDEDEESEKEEYNSGDELVLPPKYNEKIIESFLNIMDVVHRNRNALTPNLKCRYLSILSHKALPHVKEPLDYTDLFFNAFETGGEKGVAALHGVYYLITRHALIYPDFYEKVYTMLDDDALNVTHRRNFFQTVQDILFSPYVSQHILAAFLKKASQLALNNSNGRLLVIAFIKNILAKYPMMHFLLQNREPSTLDEDVFIEGETIENCRAMESSLFELDILMDNAMPGVSRVVSFIKRDLPEHITRLDTYNKNSQIKMFEYALKTQLPEVSATFDKPTKNSNPGNEMDIDMSFWFQ